MAISLLNGSIFLLFIAININLNFCEEDESCMSDCTYQKANGDDITKDGYYCASTKRDNSGRGQNTWKGVGPCVPHKPEIKKNVIMPNLYRYETKKKLYYCNGRCGRFYRMSFDWCYSNDYNQYEICLPNKLKFHSNYWGNLLYQIRAAKSKYQGNQNQISNPVQLNIDQIYSASVAKREEVFTASINSKQNPMKTITSVFVPGNLYFKPTLMTVSMSAILTIDFVANDYRAFLSDTIRKRFHDLNSNEKDEPQCLLPIVLGGSLDLRNIFPFKIFDRTDANGTILVNKELHFLHDVENTLELFLIDNYKSYAEWKAVIDYDNILKLRPSNFLISIKLRNEHGMGHPHDKAPFNGRDYFEFIVNNDSEEYVKL